MSRKPIIAGNWKMNLLQNDAKALYDGISAFVSKYSAVQLPSVVIAPVFTCLNQVKEIPCAAQNCHWESSGAYTGEISVEMAKDAGCSYIIIGHSERRQYFSETDEMINKKAKAILFVSQYMKDHYENLANRSFTSKSYIMPCFNEVFDPTVYDNKDYNNKTFTYVGSLDLWQCFEQTTNLYKQIEDAIPEARLKVLTFDTANAERIIKEKGETDNGEK